MEEPQSSSYLGSFLSGNSKNNHNVRTLIEKPRQALLGIRMYDVLDLEQLTRLSFEHKPNPNEFKLK